MQERSAAIDIESHSEHSQTVVRWVRCFAEVLTGFNPFRFTGGPRRMRRR